MVKQINVTRNALCLVDKSGYNDLMKKSEREIRELAAKYGFEVLRTKNNHFKLVRPGCVTVISSSTASDWRTLKNLEGQLRRSLKGGE
jgi:hypothetical protein